MPWETTGKDEEEAPRLAVLLLDERSSDGALRPHTTSKGYRGRRLALELDQRPAACSARPRALLGRLGSLSSTAGLRAGDGVGASAAPRP